MTVSRTFSLAINNNKIKPQTGLRKKKKKRAAGADCRHGCIWEFRPCHQESVLPCPLALLTLLLALFSVRRSPRSPPGDRMVQQPLVDICSSVTHLIPKTPTEAPGFIMVGPAQVMCPFQLLALIGQFWR